MNQAGAATDERVARQIEQFKRKCGVHGEETLRFAYHAALPVALNPEFLHLLRINFFVDIEYPLPYEVEFELLLSSLCRQIDEGLYEIERDVRLVLLEGLAREFGQERMREVAMLLWEYMEQQEPWAERVGLERAQQLTVLNFLDSIQAKQWLDSATTRSQQVEEFQKEWLVAMGLEVERTLSFLEPDQAISPEIQAEWREVLRLAFEENLQDKAIAEKMAVQLKIIQLIWKDIHELLDINHKQIIGRTNHLRANCKLRAIQAGLLDDSKLKNPVVIYTEKNSVTVERMTALLKGSYPSARIITSNSFSQALDQLQKYEAEVWITELNIPKIENDTKLSRPQNGISAIKKILETQPNLNIAIYSNYGKCLVRIVEQLDDHRGGFVIIEKTDLAKKLLNYSTLH